MFVSEQSASICPSPQTRLKLEAFNTHCDCAQALIDLRCHLSVCTARRRMDVSRSPTGGIDYSGYIVLSEHFLTCAHTTHADITNTILHEIAHARVGPGRGHDEVWRAEARRIGCTGDTHLPYDFAPPGPWLLTCGCGAGQLRRHRLHRKMLERWCCRTCKGPLHPKRVAS